MGLRPFGRRYDTRMYVTEREGRSSVGAKRRTKAEVIGVRLQADGPIGRLAAGMAVVDVAVVGWMAARRRPRRRQ